MIRTKKDRAAAEHADLDMPETVEQYVDREANGWKPMTRWIVASLAVLIFIAVFIAVCRVAG